MKKFKTIAITVLIASALPALAQVAPQEETTTRSQPGKVSKTQVVTASVKIVGMDKATRKLKLKGPDGRVIEVVAGPEVKNFDQIQLNDRVKIDYVRSLSLELQKLPASTDTAVATSAASAKPGEKPAGVMASVVTIVAEVENVNPAANTITLKGPRGNSVELDVKNPDQFKVVKVGDKVRVEYSEAVAMSVHTLPK